MNTNLKSISTLLVRVLAIFFILSSSKGLLDSYTHQYLAGNQKAQLAEVMGGLADSELYDEMMNAVDEVDTSSATPYILRGSFLVLGFIMLFMSRPIGGVLCRGIE